MGRLSFPLPQPLHFSLPPLSHVSRLPPPSIDTPSSNARRSPIPTKRETEGLFCPSSPITSFAQMGQRGFFGHYTPPSFECETEGFFLVTTLHLTAPSGTPLPRLRGSLPAAT